MWEGRRALDAALSLAHMPTLAVAMRLQPTPPDILVIIRIAAGCEDTSREAERVTGLPIKKIQEAATLYLQLILMAPESDDHRVLGVRPGASRSEMREHMRWLMLWLHPDRNRNEWESVFAERVTKAWRHVGSRASQPTLNRPHQRLVSGASPAKHKPSRMDLNRWVALPIRPSRPTTGEHHWTLVVALIGVLLLAISSMRMLPPIQKWLLQKSVAEERSYRAPP